MKSLLFLSDDCFYSLANWGQSATRVPFETLALGKSIELIETAVESNRLCNRITLHVLYTNLIVRVHSYLQPLCKSNIIVDDATNSHSKALLLHVSEFPST